MSNFVLPYEPDDVRHLDEEKQRREIKEWLKRLCEVSVVSPSIVPEVHDRRR
jgi:nicotinamide riboside kinase